MPEPPGVAHDNVLPLGAAYFPSAAGITPERVHPFAVRIAGAVGELPYDFVPLAELRAKAQSRIGVTADAVA